MCFGFSLVTLISSRDKHVRYVVHSAVVSCPYSETLLSYHHYFSKALVEESHVFDDDFGDGLANFLVYYKEKLP